MLPASGQVFLRRTSKGSSDDFEPLMQETDDSNTGMNCSSFVNPGSFDALQLKTTNVTNYNTAVDSWLDALVRDWLGHSPPGNSSG